MGRIGKRLALLMGTNEYNYRWYTRRENLLKQWPGSARSNGSAWNARLAAVAARRMEDKGLFTIPDSIVILLGRRVANAFHYSRAQWFYEFTRRSFLDGAALVTVVVAPHPSGANRWWNDPKNWNEAARFWRRIFLKATVELKNPYCEYYGERR